MQHQFVRDAMIASPIPTALSIAEICVKLSIAAHEAGLYRMSFLLQEITEEAALAIDVAQNVEEPAGA